jgi:hypothetical protein
MMTGGRRRVHSKEHLLGQDSPDGDSAGEWSQLSLLPLGFPVLDE